MKTKHFTKVNFFFLIRKQLIILQHFQNNKMLYRQSQHEMIKIKQKDLQYWIFKDLKI